MTQHAYSRLSSLLMSESENFLSRLICSNQICKRLHMYMAVLDDSTLTCVQAALMPDNWWPWPMHHCYERSLQWPPMESCGMDVRCMEHDLCSMDEEERQTCSITASVPLVTWLGKSHPVISYFWPPF